MTQPFQCVSRITFLLLSELEGSQHAHLAILLGHSVLLATEINNSLHLNPAEVADLYHVSRLEVELAIDELHRIGAIVVKESAGMMLLLPTETFLEAKRIAIRDSEGSLSKQAEVIH